jgi:predicted permease
MIRTLLNLADETPGFDPEHTIAVSLSPSPAQCPTRESLASFTDEAIRRLRAVPGVETVGGISFMPLVGYNPGTDFAIDGRTPVSPEATPRADYQQVTPDYFRAMGMPVVRGRPFTEDEMKSEPEVVIVNQALAARFWPGEDALGRRIHLMGTAGPHHSLAIVGVVGDVKQFGLHTDPRPELYLPQCTRSMTLIVRTAWTPASLLPSVRETVRRLAGDQAAFSLRTMGQALRDSTEKRRVFAWLLGALAGIALAMTALGTYGVISHLTAQRMREMGVRLALGARPLDVLGLVVRQGMTLALSGVACGFVGALALMRAMRSLLFGVSPADPLTFSIAAVVLIGVALVACYLPARHAAKCDPLTALRYE